MRAVEAEAFKVVMEYVYEVSNSSIDEEVKGRFRARARQAPSDISFNGLAYTLVTFAARSNAESLEELGLRTHDLKELIDILTNEQRREKLGLRSAEEASYALYGGLLLLILRKLGYLDALTLREVILRALKDPLLNEASLRVSILIKRFAEAFISRGVPS